jgi:hypothetical protein
MSLSLEQQLFYDILVDIKVSLQKQLKLAEVADTRGRAIAEMWESQEKLKIARPNPSPGMINKGVDYNDVRPYDWWRLKNGTYAKVYKTVLEGEIYQEDGKALTVGRWNPLNLRDINGVTSLDLQNRKTGDNPAGWPDWCK